MKLQLFRCDEMGDYALDCGKSEDSLLINDSGTYIATFMFP